LLSLVCKNCKEDTENDYKTVSNIVEMNMKINTQNFEVYCEILQQLFKNNINYASIALKKLILNETQSYKFQNNMKLISLIFADLKEFKDKQLGHILQELCFDSQYNQTLENITKKLIKSLYFNIDLRELCKSLMIEKLEEKEGIECICQIIELINNVCSIYVSKTAPLQEIDIRFVLAHIQVKLI
jgi:hypothetical protein